MPSSSHSSCSPVVLGAPRSQTPTPLLTVAVWGAVVAVGAAVAAGVGDGSWSVDDFADALSARDRQRSAAAAPAHGLYLIAVEYDTQATQSPD